MDRPGLNYFTCTLGQSALWKEQADTHQKAFDTVLDLVADQAREFPDHPAFGIADFTSKIANQPSFITFRELDRLADLAANALSHIVTSPGAQAQSPTETVGLICMTSLDFVLTWLGLMRLGHTVFLLAPQLDSAAVNHLCEGSGVRRILVDELQKYEKLQLNLEIRLHQIPDYQRSDLAPRPGPFNSLNHHTTDLAYIRHTSGTSSGLPKPIPQSHWGAVGALPRLPDNHRIATFSTTPLYHGGLADCFRAWTSGAMIWFFPEGRAPVIETSVIQAVLHARKASPVDVGYFTCVPYILQALGSNDDGLQLLRTMELVGVGGAALADAVGDKLVAAEVRLVSRMGSAECGFLMSSDRDYEKDREWQYLRPVDDSRFLAFEARDSGLFELVAKPKWPLRLQTNREDGSYATSDLFLPHPTIQNAWRYHSRADAQVTLANGKKFDPSPIEAMLLASASTIRDVLVFGTGKDYPGALLFPLNKDLTAEAVMEDVWPAIQEVNKQSQGHARLARSALVVVPSTDGSSPLEKSSKGTILRRQAENRYATQIESVYDITQSGSGDADYVTDDKVLSFVTQLFSDMLGRDLNPDEDLFKQGVDSMACIQARKSLMARLVPPESGSLPLNVIYEQGTVAALTKYLLRLRHAEPGVGFGDSSEGDQTELMMELVKKYSKFSFEIPELTASRTVGETVALTGATGALGSHILHWLRGNPRIRRVYCLLRARTHTAAHERVSQALRKRELPGLDLVNQYPDWDGKVVCLSSDLADANLGLSDVEFGRLSEKATLFVHAAWTVNFSLRLRSFEDQLAATQNLLRVAVSSGGRFVFISSTAAAASLKEQSIPEALSSDPSDASPLGYSRSKWVAEAICAAAHKSVANGRAGDHVRQPRVSVIRVGQLCGNAAGVWNASEAYPLMLSTAKLTGCLPDIEGEALNWLPVDAAAKSVLEIALHQPEDGPAVSVSPVYHILNPHKTPSWESMLQWLRDDARSDNFKVVSPDEWVSRLAESLSGSSRGHPAEKLLGFWGRAFSRRESTSEVIRKSPPRPTFGLEQTCLLSSIMREVKPLHRDQVIRMWHWIIENIEMTAEQLGKEGGSI